MSLPMPTSKEYATPLDRFYHYVWDTKDVPAVQESEGFAVITPTFDNLHIYGRAVGSPYPEDERGLVQLQNQGRFMGEWFSVACSEGELGSMAYEDVEQITKAEFSAAYERGWEHE